MSNMKKLLLFLVFLLMIYASPAQQIFSEILYLDDFSGVQSASIEQAPDSSYIIAGYTCPMMGMVDFPMLLRIDKDGNCMWTKKYITETGDFFTKVIMYQNNSFIVAGITSGNNLLIGKFSLTGEPVWFKKLLTGVSLATAAESPDNSIVFTASSNGNPGGMTSTVVLKVDGDGNIQWAKSFASGDLLRLSSVALVQGTDIVLYGTCFTGNAYPDDREGILLKLNTNGDIDWGKKIVTTPLSRCYGHSIVSDGDSLIFISDHTLQYQNSYASVIKTDISGNIGWSTKMYYGIGMNSSIKVNEAGYFFLSSDMFAVFNTLTRAGEFDVSSSMQLIGVDVTSAWDGGYMACGNGPIFLLGNTDYYGMQIGVYKLDQEGNGATCVAPNFPWVDTVTVLMAPVTVTSSTETVTAENLQPAVNSLVTLKAYSCIEIIGGVTETNGISMVVTPNPVTDRAFVKLSDQYISGTYTISDITGRSCFSGFYHGNSFSINRNGIPAGTYFLILKNNEGSITGKSTIIFK